MHEYARTYSDPALACNEGPDGAIAVGALP